ncbi:MAG: adenine phosphoribosyltransferase [Corynebacterium sp.]|nr:adenine phosphoribosyltransferase [Corynebacterium sp.]
MTHSAPTYSSAAEAIAAHIRYVPDFPEKGILFEDLTPVFADPAAFRAVIDGLADRCRAMEADIIGGLDARGFLLGSAVAYKLGLGVLAVRKAGKLPPPVVSQEYKLEYGTAALEIPLGDPDLHGKKIVLVDDVLATGGTLAAAQSLLREAGADVVGHVVVLEVEGLGGREKLGDVPVAVLNAAGE